MASEPPQLEKLVTDQQIYGDTKEMLTWSPEGPAKVYPARDIVPKIAGADHFKAKDTVATKALVSFMRNAQAGIDAYNNGIYQSAGLYLNADSLSETEMLSVVGSKWIDHGNVS